MLHAFWQWLYVLPTVVGITFAAGLTTVGWLYSARRVRTLSRKQHTFTALNASFNHDYQEAMQLIGSVAQANRPLDFNDPDSAKKIKFILNHYEFLAAGIRNGDISEKLLRDSERGTVVHLYEITEGYIQKIRESRKRKVIFEHITWLVERWHYKPVSNWHKLLETALGRPFYHRYHCWISWAVLILMAVALGWGYWDISTTAFASRL